MIKPLFYLIIIEVFNISSSLSEDTSSKNFNNEPFFSLSDSVSDKKSKEHFKKIFQKIFKFKFHKSKQKGGMDRCSLNDSVN